MILSKVAIILLVMIEQVFNIVEPIRIKNRPLFVVRVWKLKVVSI